VEHRRKQAFLIRENDLLFVHTVSPG
jgi:hypothetical protein